MNKLTGLALVGASSLLVVGAHNLDRFSFFNESVPSSTIDLPNIDGVNTINKELFDINETFITNINGIYYAWPVGRPHKQLYRGKIDLPCDIATCHHDGTAAIDFLYADAGSTNPYRPENAGVTGEDSIVGEPVRAMVAGNVKYTKIYKDIPDCYQLKIEGVDGYDYWYGHITDLQVQESMQVQAGQSIAAVGRLACVNSPTPELTAAHAHIDRVPHGLESSKQNRDAGFVALINTLWTELPE